MANRYEADRQFARGFREQGQSTWKAERDSPIAVAACFRHDEAEDGMFIPASIEEYMEWAPGDHIVVRPIVGFMALRVGEKVLWSFIKYQASDVQWKWVHVARFSTTRVGHIYCPTCGTSCLYPVSGRSEMVRCPNCGHRGLNVSYVKETSREFFELLGELKDPLEQAVAEVDVRSAGEFRYPNLFLIGHLKASSSISRRMQMEAAKTGCTLRLGTEASIEELTSYDMDGPETGLAIEPGIVSGVLDANSIREGWSRLDGVVSQFVKLPWLPNIPPRTRKRPDKAEFWSPPFQTFRGFRI